uniref:Uncharacterized protein n=1 Tax=Arundo donax TaxID=35708 RepID=A0A0A8Y697_ARUDO
MYIKKREKENTDLLVSIHNVQVHMPISGNSNVRIMDV